MSHLQGLGVTRITLHRERASAAPRAAERGRLSAWYQRVLEELV